MISAQEAIEELTGNPDKYRTQEALFALAERVDATNSSGSVTILYSGRSISGFSAGGVLAAMQINGDSIRIIDNTDAAFFLESDAFKSGLADIYGLNYADMGMKGWVPSSTQAEAISRMNSALYGPDSGPWAKASERFVDATHGEVRTLTGGAVSDRVFGQAEVPRLLKNEKITFVDGVPIEDLRRLGEERAFKVISAQSEIYSAELKFAVDERGHVVKVGDLEVPRVDSRNFFEATGLDGNSPVVEVENYRGAVEYPTHYSTERLAQHKEGAELLHEIKQGYLEQSKLSAPEHAALRATALRALDKLGWAGDLIALGLVAGEANAAYAEGNTAEAANILGRWAADFSGGLAGGLAAAQIVGSALAPLYLAGPAGAVIAGGLTLLAGLAGGILGGAAASAAYDAIINDLKLSFGHALTTVSPLVLDLDGDGVSTIGLQSGVHFDLDHNGYAEQTGWIHANDGMLVRDLNLNGKIDSGAELFGNHTRLNNGMLAANGFDALKELDANGDGVVNAQDAAFDSLRLWIDANGDGKTDEGELHSLASRGITSLNVAYDNLGLNAAEDAQGQQHRQLGAYVTSDGAVHAMNDVWFTTDAVRTVLVDQVPVSAEIAKLPDVPGMGEVPSLHQAMARDASGALQALVERWITASHEERPEILEQIVFAWTGGADVASGSRGPNIDARQLHAVEHLVGGQFEQGSGTNGGALERPGVYAAAVLKAAYLKVADYVAAELFRQTDLVAMLEGVALVFDADAQVMRHDATALVEGLFAAWQVDVSPGHRWARAQAREVMNLIDSMGASGLPLASRLLTTGAALDEAFGFMLTYSRLTLMQGTERDDALTTAVGQGASLLMGGAGNDRLTAGHQGDVLIGGDGDDSLRGGDGNDILAGGTGNDFLSGGKGSDIYRFNFGDGQDTLSDDETGPNAGIDVLQLGAGLTPQNTVTTKVGNDLVLSWGGADSVRISYYFFSTSCRIEQVQFHDGTVWGFPALMAQLIIDGGPGTDYLDGVAGVGNRINGLGGNDTLSGRNMDDVLNGGAGNDRLYGAEGNDTLIGGAGDDFLDGGYGSDTYVFNRGDGHDTLSDDETGPNAGIDVLQLGAGLTPQNTVTTKVGNDLVLSWGGADSVRISYYFFSTSCRIEQVQFHDGTVWGFPALMAQLIIDGGPGTDYLDGVAGVGNRINGLDGNDSINGKNMDDVLNGGAGNDQLFGADGNDILIGGTGDDYLNGGYGSDTYLFNVGDGNDTIADYESGANAGIDILKLGAGLKPQDTVTAKIGNDLVLSWGGADSVRISNYFYIAAYQVEQIQFHDGTVWSFDELIAGLVNDGGAGNDVLDGVFGVDNRINGWDGNDTLNGRNMDDVLNGGAGNDHLFGADGNDILIGGTGDDHLNGGYGNDTYLFTLGDGHDTIADYDPTRGNTDTLRFGDGIDLSRLWFTRSGNHLDISIRGTNDKVTVNNWFYGSAYQVEEIRSEDDDVLTAAQMSVLAQEMAGLTPPAWQAF